MMKTVSGLYFITTANIAKNRIIVLYEIPVLTKMVTAAERIMPMMAGRNPLNAAFRAGALLILAKNLEQMTIRMAVGRNIDKVALRAPKNPASL
jgi:hypothetical protein